MVRLEFLSALTARRRMHSLCPCHMQSALLRTSSDTALVACGPALLGFRHQSCTAQTLRRTCTAGQLATLEQYGLTPGGTQSHTVYLRVHGGEFPALIALRVRGTGSLRSGLAPWKVP
jgi:hypothetical protein